MQSRMDYLFHHRKSSPSGMQLAGQMGIERLRLKKQTSNPLNPPTQIRTVLRWGSAMDLPSSFQPEYTINTPQAISKAGNKNLTVEALSHAGILVPNISRGYSDVSALRFPVLGRSSHGSQGKDIVVYENKTQIPQNHSHDFFSEYIPNTREYRIHVVRGEIIRVQGKYLDFPEQAGSGYIKNHSHGYRFRTPDKELNNDRKEAAIAAINALGLDFGAVDLIVGEDRKAYVLEVNTAPAMSPMTLGQYAEAFNKILSANKTTTIYPVGTSYRNTAVSVSKPRTAPRRVITTPTIVETPQRLTTPKRSKLCQAPGCGWRRYKNGYCSQHGGLKKKKAPKGGKKLPMRSMS